VSDWSSDVCSYDLTVNSGTAPTQLGNVNSGAQIDLGTNITGKVGLTQTELNNVTAGALRVGSVTAGAITISAAITAPAGWNTLTLVSNDAVGESAAGTLTVPNLRLATKSAFLTAANKVGTLAGRDISGSLVFSSIDPLTV